MNPGHYPKITAHKANPDPWNTEEKKIHIHMSKKSNLELIAFKSLTAFSALLGSMVVWAALVAAVSVDPTALSQPIVGNIIFLKSMCRFIIKNKAI